VQKNATMKKEVIFLDRDGTINVDHGYTYKVEDWEFTDKAPQALKELQDAGFSLCVVTNQSGIGHDLYTTKDMEKLHEHMRSELAKDGVVIEAIAFCPHHREAGCNCRKPKTAMIKQIEKEIGSIDYTKSWTIGDKFADVELGNNAGTKTILIKSQYWNDVDLKELSKKPNEIVNNLFEAAQIICNK
jgi:D-glycero-D-manno-heptose 1,7-bisphosphate phosphatase